MTDVLPKLIAPMLAAGGSLPAGGGWAFEFKYDGVRAVTYLSGGQVLAFSRNGNDITSHYPELTTVAELLPGRQAVLDGEIVALEAGNRPSFAHLSARIHVARPTDALLRTVPVVYYLFDLLQLDGIPLVDEPYERRRELLAGLGLDSGNVRTPPEFRGTDGRAVLKAAELGGLEGVVAKRLGSPYRPGKRSSDWTKVPLIRTQEVLIVGWKKGEGRRSGLIGSLLLAVQDEAGRLRFAGHVGTGFTDVALRQLAEQLAPLHRSTPPIADVPREHARHAHWVEPTLVGEVAFRNWTPDDRLRHPSWRGLRTDRSPSAAKRHPTSPPPPPRTEVVGVMMTPDQRCRVEVVRRAGVESFRVAHGDNVVEGLDLGAVQKLLASRGIDLMTLEQADPAA